MFSAVLALLVAAVVAVNADGSNDTTAGGAGSGDDVGDHRDVLPEFCRRHPQIRLSEDYNPREGPDLGDENEGGEDGGRRRKKVPVLSNYLIPDVSGVDDHRRVMAMNIVVYKRWVDPRISASNLTEAVSLSPEFYSQCLWSPTFVYDNLHSVDNWDLIKPPAIYVVQPGPVITYSTFNKLSVSCIMNFNSYPFDVQTCEVVEIAFGVAGNWIEIVGSVSHDSEDQRELQYAVELEESDVKSKKYFGIDVSAFGWKVKLTRHLGTHILSTYLPTSLFVAASWISFLIPPDVVPGRMTLLVTLLLMEVNIFLTVADEAPRTPRMSSLLIWCISCITIVMAAVIQYGVILYQMHLGKRVEPSEEDAAKSGATKQRGSGRKNTNKLDRISFFVFPTASLFLTLVYWIYHLSL